MNDWRWEIVPYVGVGPLKFGMTADQVEQILGPPGRVRVNGDRRRESRARGMPVIHYVAGVASEIEVFREMRNLGLGGIRLFSEPGRDVLKKLEAANGGALESVGCVLFENLGIATGRLDIDVPEDHTVCAFRRGVWDGKLEGFEPLSFQS
jgi:hypothetical protein